MVTYIRSDLDFILDQIKIAEAHAGGQPLFGPGGLVPAYNVSLGLRTVDGSYNHLLPGQEQWGAADRQFPSLLDPQYRPADGTPFDPDGPGGAPAMPTSPNYQPSNNPNSLVFDSSLRTISNLIVDQTLANPAAILEAIRRAGGDPADLGAVTTIYQTFKPAAVAEYQARVVYEAARVAANALDDGDPLTPPTPEETAAIAARDAAQAAHQVTVVALEAAREVRNDALELYGITMDGDNVHLPNTSPDVGLSAPFNSWFTLFGQFFDHGLDLVNKGGSGTVFVPLQPDDPLYVPGSPTNFMVLTRATVSAGTDGIMGTSDDVRPVNTTTSYVDQNQTYTSHASHQVFLRQYEVNGEGRPVATGKLIEGGNGGMATWGELKAQAEMLGILLTDQDVGKVPLLRTDQYGNFIPNDDGYAQVITGVGPDGIPNTADDIVISGTPGSPVSLATAIRTNHAFLADIAHDAVPNGIEDGDITIGLANPGNNPAVYDNELLDAHFIAGDGRVNENIGLTAVHHVFHAEHNRLVEHTKEVVLADAAALLAGGASPAEAVAFLNEWLVTDVAAVPASVNDVVWDGERLFQAAKFGTEMQYQHLVFEEFARKVQPQVDFFIVPDGFDTTINPDIVAEFAHVVYRFGHSMLTEKIDRYDASFNADHIGLIEGFLNPSAFDSNHAVEDGLAAGDIIRGMTRQVGNEIDEFVTSALRNNLLGLPLDLATINLARGRDTGVPSLNEARREFYEVTNNDARLRPYDSWVDFAGNLKNEASIINFIAAYGTHSLITSETTVEGKRAAAMAIVFNGVDTPPDAEDFLNGTGAYASNLGGLDNVDLWIGGLAEKILPFGGMLGSTFNFVFEVQMENLQNADRFYYLQRLDGLHLFGEMENNSFASLIMRNTNATHLPSAVFSTPGIILEVDRTKQYNPGLGETAGADGILEDDTLTGADESADNLGNDPVGTSIFTPLVIRNNPATVGPDTNYLRYTGVDHVVLGGTEGNDILIASEGDDAIYGDGGADTIEGGAGADIINGGAGDDIIRDLGGDDNIKAGDGNDAVNTGPGLDLVLGGRGQDFIVLGNDAGSEVFAGEGNDFILGNITAERILGNEGDDWIQFGTFDGAPGDNFDEIFARDGVRGNDVFFGLGGFDEFIGEGGDDIMVGSAGVGKMVGMSGFDWTIYKDNTAGTNADLFRLAFDESPIPPGNAALDVYDGIEGLSGSRFNDTLRGSDDTAAQIGPTLALGGTHGYLGSTLDAKGIALVTGLQAVVGVANSFSGGEIILGGDGNDLIEGRGGDDIIDGDKWLDVQIGVFAPGDTGHTGTPISLHNSMTTLVNSVFAGTINPGQLAIVRTIRTDATAGDVDTVVFSGARAEYTFGLDGLGRLTVSHTGGTLTDGTDTISNVELLQFTDQVVDLRVTAPSDIQWNGVTPGNGTANLGNLANGLPGAGAVIANLSTTDDDTSSGFVYSLAPGSSAGFAVSAAGVVTRTGTAMASNATYTVNVTSTDTTGGARTESFNIRTGTNSVLFGAPGTDTLTASAVDSVLYGSGANDVLNGSGANNNMFGQQGNDLLNGLGGNDILVGGTGVDTVLGGGGNDIIRHTVGDGGGITDGGAGTDALVIGGGAGGDSLSVTFNGTAITAVEGGTVTGIESVTLDLGGGTDTLVYVAPGGVTVDLAAGTASGFAAIANVENVTGNGGADALTGNAQANTLTGNGGADILNGGTGGDILIGGAGADTVNTGAPNDNVQDIVRFVAVADFGDTVLNFDANGADGVDDRIEFNGTLNTAWDDGLANDNILFASGNGAAGVVNALVGQNNADFEALFLSGVGSEGVTLANLGNAAAVSAAFNAEFNITALNGEDALLVVNDTDANSFALWQWIQAGGGETSAAELTLIAIVTANATVSTGNFDFI